MRAVVTRVKSASVTIDGRVNGEIGQGLLVLLGVGPSDTEAQAVKLADKVCGLRIFETQDTLVSVVCMVAGAALGEWINIEYKLQQLGEWCKSRIPAGQVSGTFVEAFVSSSLLFCVGAMAIVGSLEDGLSHNYNTLFTKAVMDGVLSVVFTAALGIGTAFSVFPVAIYQGSITLLAGLVRPFLTDIMITRVSCIGSILIFGLGLNLVLGSKIKIGNLLPAVFLPIIACLLGF